MPHILLVSATATEIQPVLDRYSVISAGEGVIETLLNEKDKLSVLITGVGMVNMAWHMGNVSSNYYDFVINAGIAGSFQKYFEPGDVVRVIRDELCEMGAEDGPSFLRYQQMELGGTNIFSENWNIKTETADKLQRVKAITVNKVHGNDASIAFTKQLFNPDIESMEGAAFFSGCRRFGNYIQLRAISNYVERRDKSKWKIPLAIENLNKIVFSLLEELFYVD